MGRLIDEEELEKYIIHDGCDEGCGYIDERDLKYIPATEAIPKADYEACLKADMVAMLTDIQIEIQENQECANTGNWNNDLFSGGYDNGLDTSCDIIQEKINALKGETDESNT